MIEEVHLKDLIDNLNGTVIKLNATFLKNLLINAAKSDRPWSDKEFVKKMEVKKYTVYQWFKGKRNISANKLKRTVSLSGYNWKDVERNLIFIKTKAGGSKLFLKFPLKIGRETGSIVGHILGDGSIERRFSQMFYTNSNKELLKEFQSFMLKTFNIKPRIWYQETNNFNGKKSKWIKRVNSIDEIPEEFQGGMFYPKICSVILYSIFDKFASGKHKEITKQILNTNKKFKIGLIRAFFDDEGSPVENGYDIRLFQDSKSILENFRKFLSEFDIWSNEVLSYYKNKKIRYYFSITNHYNFIKFYNTIGFTSTEKKDKLKVMIDNIIINKTFRLRHNEAKNNILEFLKTRNQLTTKEISYFMKNKFSDFKWNKSTILEHLNSLNESGKVNKQKVGFRYLWKFNNA